MSWLDEHLETFVRPKLGLIPDVDMANQYLIGRWDAKMNRVLRAVWERAKIRAMGRPILLPGRDVWEFEVLARMEGFPTTFRPEFSGEVVRSGLIKEDFSQHFVLDSGYAGSVPKSLKTPYFALVVKGPTQLFRLNATSGKVQPLSAQNITDKLLHQVFPNARMFRPHDPKKPPETPAEQPLIMKLATALEGNPKYWYSGSTNDGFKIYQAIANDETFKAAAILTQFIAMGANGTK